MLYIVKLNRPNLHKQDILKHNYLQLKNTLSRFKELCADIYALLQNINCADALGNYFSRLPHNPNDLKRPSEANRTSYCRLIRDMLIEESWGRPVDGYLQMLDNLMYQAVHV